MNKLLTHLLRDITSVEKEEKLFNSEFISILRGLINYFFIAKLITHLVSYCILVFYHDELVLMYEISKLYPIWWAPIFNIIRINIEKANNFILSGNKPSFDLIILEKIYSVRSNLAYEIINFLLCVAIIYYVNKKFNSIEPNNRVYSSSIKQNSTDSPKPELVEKFKSANPNSDIIWSHEESDN